MLARDSKNILTADDNFKDFKFYPESGIEGGIAPSMAPDAT